MPFRGALSLALRSVRTRERIGEEMVQWRFEQFGGNGMIGDVAEDGFLQKISRWLGYRARYASEKSEVA